MKMDVEIETKELVNHIKQLLNYELVKDSSYNGLQFEGKGTVRKIVTAVDACKQLFDEGKKRNADFAIVHHGMFWKGSEVTNIDGFYREKLSSMLESNMNLFALHLPLDLHPEFGNNAIIARLLGVEKVEFFSECHGNKVGAWGKLKKPQKITSLLSEIEKKIGKITTHLPFGPDRISKIAVISGGGGFGISDPEIAEEGIDLFLTGEVLHQHYFPARERNVHAVGAGHYQTEVFGVRALGEFLARKFNLKHEFIEIPTGL
ncbi:MAG: Nif3-like dinuclear metal center hexameric protein [Candidatus Riflebacteria bacterium]|nr:Nif3-like dinuclear metal center hexameric protein [Candidatus Riflebacteria bacterium]